ncbi:microtubule associated protein 1A [Echinococcus multilocularis]|uniref:Microtubule associated protein 1A n=1 Tax=Echinococcus multilocularis TaxID=6211 RepID=A0A068Y5F7_ECHMU|nr:microtubule associated protein 1A [Echinococcus multilocularis]
MSQANIIIVIGETSNVPDKTSLVSHINDGLASIPHFDLLKINEALGSVDCLEPLSDGDTQRFATLRKDGFKFISPEVNVVLLRGTTVEYILEELDNAVTLLPHLIALVYTGDICQTTGYWVLSDSVLKPDYVTERISLISGKLHQSLADTAKESMPPMSLHIACSSLPSGGEWRHVLSSRLPSAIAGRPLHVTVNRLHTPTKKAPAGISAKPELAPLPADLSGVEAFCQRLEPMIPTPVPPAVCQPAAKTDGCSIRIQRPCLYIFPEGSGQSAIFALPGFTLMVNAGCSWEPKCWKMAQHLENIDAILHTHWGAENTLGLASLLPALMASSDSTSLLPKVTCLLTPPPGYMISQPPPPSTMALTDPLVLNVAKVMGDLALAMKPAIADSRLITMEVSRGAKMAAVPKPLPLYYRAGFGSLELYPLTPTEEDQADVKKLAEMWVKSASSMAAALATAAKGPTTALKQTGIPLASQLSISALLIWKPARKSDRLLRVLFVAPNAHQLRVLTALEALHVGVPYIHHVEPYPVPSTTISGVARRVASARPAASAPRAAPHAPKSAITSKAPTKLAPKVEARQLKSAPPPSHKPTSMLTKTAPPLKTNEVVKEKKKKDEKEKNETPAEMVAEITPPVEPTPEVDHQSPTPEVMKGMNGGDGVATSPVKSMDENHLFDGEQQAVMEPGAELLYPPHDWGQPQAMPAPTSAPAKGTRQTGAKLASPGVAHPEGYYEASMGFSKGLYEKLAKRTFVDVAFLPGGGDVSLVDVEFFKRVLARYYVATTVAPTADLLKALAVGKAAWHGDKATAVGGNHEVSLILSHDTPGLLEWALLNEKRLTDNDIDLLTVAERSTIQLVTADSAAGGDRNANDLSCPGFRLDF